MFAEWQSYKWIVVREAAKFRKYNRRKLRGLTLDDLIVTGLNGLYKAATTYEPLRSNFLTWAAKKVWSEMRDWVDLVNRQFERTSVFISADTKYAGRILDMNEGGGTSAFIAKDWWEVTLRRIGYRFNPAHCEIARMMGEGIKSQREIGVLLGMTECAVSQAWKKMRNMVKAWEDEAERFRAA